MAHDDAASNVFPGDMDDFTPAITFLKRYAKAARVEVEGALTQLDQDYNTAKANIESGTLLVQTTLNAQMTTVRSSVFTGYTTSGEAVGDMETPLVALDQYVSQALDYNPDKPDYNSPVYYYPGSWYNNKLSGGVSHDYAVVRYNRLHEFMADDEGVPTQFVGDLCHGLVLHEEESESFEAHAIMDGEVMAVIEDDPFFGNMIVIRQTDGLWARYYQLLNFNRWDWQAEWVPDIKVGDAVHAGDGLALAGDQFFLDVCHTDRLRLNYYDWAGTDLGIIRDNYLALDRVGTGDDPAYYVTGTYYGLIDPDVYIYPLYDMLEGNYQTVYCRLNKPITEDVDVLLQVYGDATIKDAARFTFTPEDWYSAQDTRIYAEQTDTEYVDTSLLLHFQCASDGEFNNVITTRAIQLLNDDYESEPEGPKALIVDSFPTNIDEAQAKVFYVSLGAQPSGTVTVTTLSTHRDVLDFQWEWQGATPSKKLLFDETNYSYRQPLVVRCPARSIQSDQTVVLHIVADGGGYDHVAQAREVRVKNIDFHNETPLPPATDPVPDPTPETPVPDAPTGFAGTPAVTTIALVWDVSDDSSITGYDIKVGDLAWFGIAGTLAEAIPHTVTGLTASTSYVIKIRAVNANGYGADASITVTTLASGVPAAPTNLTAYPTQSTCTLKWDDIRANASDPIPLYQSRNDTSLIWEDANAVEFGGLLQCSEANLTANTNYTFHVRLKDIGNGAGLAASVGFKTRV